ncbi:MAG: hypothetical protein HOA58_17825 [Rhodospirillaceae bacterium]|nr:hypothetical protein [Rhodospirillaceae bacterium]
MLVQMLVLLLQLVELVVDFLMLLVHQVNHVVVIIILVVVEAEQEVKLLLRLLLMLLLRAGAGTEDIRQTFDDWRYPFGR